MMYELMVAANTKTSDSLAVKVDKALKEANASNVKVERLGKKTLAYPIAKQIEGDYILYNFDAEGESVNKVAGFLRLERDAVLRYLIVKTKVSKKRTKGTRFASEARQAKSTISAKGTEEAKEEVKTPKVTVKTKAVAKKIEKVVKGSKIKKGKVRA